MADGTFINKTIVVTGAASGIGACTARLLIEQGARVIGLDRTPIAVPGIRYVPVDLSEPASIRTAAAAIDEPIHGLANIAGVPGTAPDQFLARVNYFGLRAFTVALLPKMPKGSAIANLASMAGFMWRERAELLWQLAKIDDRDAAEAWLLQHPVMFEQAYRKFKEALIVWTLAHANDWSQKLGVRMNCVSPGPVETPIFDDFKVSLGQQNVADIIERTGRAATPEDIAPVVLFLLSDASRWIVGVDLQTDGGLTSSRFATTMSAAAVAKGDQ
ncbi:coniferyl-alcohol dehydrogenase [Hydrogenophaga sp.]|uniref:coniferyl-alcohol dehydrogenase n=1 Tax=Hydrogenophaga sp. TaxID=1904254 RepID=UPI003F704665